MIELTYHPPIPVKTGAALGPFIQEIRAKENARQVGRAIWHAPAGKDAAVQIVELTVGAGDQRHGVGSQLIKAVTKQALAIHKLRKMRLRRIWISVEQKSQVIARAFLTQHGYHHTATIGELLDDQDALVYVKSYD